MFENYLKYLDFLNTKISKFFNEQSPYIFCKKGCSYCCQHAEFPYSKIEAEYLKSGLRTIDKEIYNTVKSNIHAVLSEKETNKADKFLYTCPFLINNICSIYTYRGIICRTFGLLSIAANGNVKVPFCSSLGLNYSNILDKNTNTLSSEMVKQCGYNSKPLGYNINYDFLTGKKTEELFNIEFGEKKSLIDWFE